MRKPIFRLYDSISGKDVLVGTATTLHAIRQRAEDYGACVNDEWQPYLTLDGKPYDRWHL